MQSFGFATEPEASRLVKLKGPAYSSPQPHWLGFLIRDHQDAWLHAITKHSVKEYVRGQVHAQCIESFWAMLKRGHKGTYHKMSNKHLQRYVDEFVGRDNLRTLDTDHQMGSLVGSMEGKRLRYADLIAPNGLESGANPKSQNSQIEQSGLPQSGGARGF